LNLHHFSDASFIAQQTGTHVMKIQALISRNTRTNIAAVKNLSVNKISSYSSNQGGGEEHISLITVLFCFNEFAFTKSNTK